METFACNNRSRSQHGYGFNEYGGWTPNVNYYGANPGVACKWGDFPTENNCKHENASCCDGYSYNNRPFVVHKIIKQEVPCLEPREQVSYCRQRYRTDASTLRECTDVPIADILSARGYRCPEGYIGPENFYACNEAQGKVCTRPNDGYACNMGYPRNLTENTGVYNPRFAHPEYFKMYETPKHDYHEEERASAALNLELGMQAMGLHNEINELMTKLMGDPPPASPYNEAGACKGDFSSSTFGAETETETNPTQKAVDVPNNTTVVFGRRDVAVMTGESPQNVHLQYVNEFDQNAKEGEPGLHSAIQTDNTVVKPSGIAWEITESFLKEYEEKQRAEYERIRVLEELEKSKKVGPTLQDYYEKWSKQSRVHPCAPRPSVHRFCKEKPLEQPKERHKHYNHNRFQCYHSEEGHANNCANHKQGGQALHNHKHSNVNQPVYVRGAIDVVTGQMKLSEPRGKDSSPNIPLHSIQGHHHVPSGPVEKKQADHVDATPQNPNQGNDTDQLDAVEQEHVSDNQDECDLSQEEREMYENDSYYGDDNPMKYATAMAMPAPQPSDTEQPVNIAAQHLPFYVAKRIVSPTMKLQHGEKNASPETHHHYHYYRCTRHKKNHHHRHRHHHKCHRHKSKTSVQSEGSSAGPRGVDDGPTDCGCWSSSKSQQQSSDDGKPKQETQEDHELFTPSPLEQQSDAGNKEIDNAECGLFAACKGHDKECSDSKSAGTDKSSPESHLVEPVKEPLKQPASSVPTPTTAAASPFLNTYDQRHMTQPWVNYHVPQYVKAHPSGQMWMPQYMQSIPIRMPFRPRVFKRRKSRHSNPSPSSPSWCITRPPRANTAVPLYHSVAETSEQFTFRP